jgi:hypothetical protein
VSADAADDPIEALFARGVTDGLPVVPPTAERVRAAVAASGRRGDESAIPTSRSWACPERRMPSRRS